MNLNEQQQKLLDNLDQNMYYKVDNPRYSHALPSEMTPVDLNKLIETQQTGGDLNEGAINFNGGQLLL